MNDLIQFNISSYKKKKYYAMSNAYAGWFSMRTQKTPSTMAANMVMPTPEMKSKRVPPLLPHGGGAKSQIQLAPSQDRATSHLIRPLGPDCGAYTSASLPVFLMPLCQLRSAKRNARQLIKVPSGWRMRVQGQGRT